MSFHYFAAEVRTDQGEAPDASFDAVCSKDFHSAVLQAMGTNMSVLVMVMLNSWHGLILCNNKYLSGKQKSVLLLASKFLQYFSIICNRFWIYLKRRRNTFGMCHGKHVCHWIKDQNGFFNRKTSISWKQSWRRSLIWTNVQEVIRYLAVKKNS